MLKFIFGVCFTICAVLAKHEHYDGFALYDVTVSFKDQIQTIIELQKDLNLDVWSEPVPGRAGKILVAKDQRDSFEEVLKVAGIEYSVSVENIREMLEREDALLQRASARSNRSSAGAMSFDTVPTYDEVNAYLEELEMQYPDTVTLVNAGKSFEGRDIKYLKISTTNFEDSTKPVVFMQSLIHAREWITLPTTLYAIKKLVVDFTDNDLLRDLDWIIHPIVNPDGYVFSHERYRIWRKNRATGFMDGDFCRGVDLNRNFDVYFAFFSSNAPCSETFHGRGPFSEPETAIIRDIFAAHGSRIKLYFDIHSFGSLILYGYGVGFLPPNALTLNLVGVNMAQAIDSVKWPSNPNYTVGNIMMTLYPSSGSASDYGSAIGTQFSYTIELPSYANHNGFDGFLVDPDFIEQVGYETWEGIKVAARYVAQN